MSEDQCLRPPDGWRCTRPARHDGPCAAVPSDPQREGSETDSRYLAIIFGGEGPDVWDKELQISACDFSDALHQAESTAEDAGGELFSLEKWEHPSFFTSKLETEAKLTAAREALEKEKREHRETMLNLSWMTDRARNGFAFPYDRERLEMIKETLTHLDDHE